MEDQEQPQQEAPPPKPPKPYRGQYSLRVSPELYKMRKDMLRRSLDLDAQHKVPLMLIRLSCEQVLRCFNKPTLAERWFAWKLAHAPHWLLWLLDKHYRAAAREIDSLDERLMREDGEEPAVKEDDPNARST